MNQKIIRLGKPDFAMIEGKVLTMLLKPTFARVPLSSVVLIQGVLPSVKLVASVKAGKGG